MLNYRFIFCCAFLSAAFPALAQQATSLEKVTPFTIGETRQWHSAVMGEDRRINVYLPLSYQTDTLRKYPVIYLLDGSADEDFIHVAGLVQFGSFSWINMLPESIVVGIGNVDRKRDFTFPTHIAKDKQDFPTTGGSARFIDFIERELQPMVLRNYRTDTIRTLIGQSLGGLLATEILFKKPDLFDRYIIVSPSLWWDGESLLRVPPADYRSTKSVYVGVGKEGKVMENDAKRLFRQIQAAKKGNTQSYFQRFEKQNHGDVLHLAVYDAFEKIFGQKG